MADSTSPIDVDISTLPFLLNDFFVHLHSQQTLRVFLCGSQIDSTPRDLRKQVGKLIDSRMGCSSFLGEDIELIRGSVKVDQNHLRMEVEEAFRSDLIVLFLGSPGTISELTAFVMDQSLNQRLIVFNDIQYKDVKSFVNLGPLRLLGKDRLIYYDPSEAKPFRSIIAEVDRLVARAWFRRYVSDRMPAPLSEFDPFVAYSCIYIGYPLDYKKLSGIFPWSDRVLDEALKPLFDRGYLYKFGAEFRMKKSIFDLTQDRGLERSLARVRVRLLSDSLRSQAKK